MGPLKVFLKTLLLGVNFLANAFFVAFLIIGFSHARIDQGIAELGFVLVFVVPALNLLTIVIGHFDQGRVFSYFLVLTLLANLLLPFLFLLAAVGMSGSGIFPLLIIAIPTFLNAATYFAVRYIHNKDGTT